MAEQVAKGEQMKLTLAETDLLKDSVNIIADLVTEVRFTVTKNAFELIAMDPANVAMVVFKLLSSAFAEYDVKEKTTVSVNLNDLKSVLRRVKGPDTLTIQQEENKLKLTLKGNTKREFSIPLIDIDEQDQKVPDLNFTVTVRTSSDSFSDAVEDADIIGESVALGVQDGTFVISSSSDLSNARIEIPSSESTKIDGASDVRSKYSIEYLKRMIAGSRLSDTAEVSFSQDYPLKLEYKVVDKLDMTFILAPRVDND